MLEIELDVLEVMPHVVLVMIQVLILDVSSSMMASRPWALLTHTVPLRWAAAVLDEGASSNANRAARDA